MSFKEWLKAQGYKVTYNEVLKRCKGIESIANGVWSELETEYVEYCQENNLEPMGIE